ncbi:D-amino-acid dehydrogenase [Pseudochelatococcus lubricantis]|uniref:D-amino acid dehydrogenase n=1 Tax=Pseudochelatococcus lubricantis TaxID=1538102 RepID=A0ABX0UZK7_9HYPH|nr:D-amino acid dehydrogenase [Pseudochelatococcus lubricantis]NIJ57734.1 D-amino-acid dehydrogenase [Pseudochelatococcus lubricantis]
MKVIVLGAGVVGVTSAWYLAKAGCDVTVIDRQQGPALETSFANAGQISPGYASPWASPEIPLKAFKWLFMEHSPLILRPRADAAMLAWLVQMLGNCTPARYAANKARMVRIAEYSRDCLDALRAETGIAYDERTQGTLQLFRTQKQLDAVGGDIEVLRQYGVPFELLTVDGCVTAEPALKHTRHKIVGGLRLPRDETGDCFKFTNALAQQAAGAGVTFRYGVEILGLSAEGDRVTGVRTADGIEKADGVVVALGSFSPQLLKPLGLRLPVYPVKGYSITVDIADAEAAPVSTVLDDSYKVAITRLGDRIRVGGMAEVSGYQIALHPDRKGTLSLVLHDLFPHGGDPAPAQLWSGLRPMTPDSTPVIGKTRFANLYTNTGHGTLGWTMACGSGKVLADIVTGAAPELDVSDLSLARYGAG